MDTATPRAIFAALVALLSVAIPSGSAGGAASMAPTFTVNLSTPITHSGDVATGTVDVVITHDTACTLGVSVGVSGDEILHTAGNSSTLLTSYKLTGAALQHEDTTWVSSADFFSRAGLLIPGNGPLDTITLSVQGTTSGSGAPDAGAYSANFTLTLTW